MQTPVAAEMIVMQRCPRPSRNREGFPLRPRRTEASSASAPKTRAQCSLLASSAITSCDEAFRSVERMTDQVAAAVTLAGPTGAIQRLKGRGLATGVAD